MSTGLLAKPSLGPCQATLWDYQRAAKDAVRREFLHGRDSMGRRVKSALVVIPTGGGKTITFGMMVRETIERGGRALVLVHTDELYRQALEKLDYLGVEAQGEKAGSRARALYDPDAVVACVPTMDLDRLATEWTDREYFNLIITDEAHRALSPSYMRIYAHFPKAYHVGVTATPIRGDRQSLRKVYQVEAFKVDMISLMTAPDPGPYLCRIKFLSQDVGLDLRDLRKRKNGDFNKDELEARIAPHCERLANWFRERWECRPSIIFTPGIGSAQGVATALQTLGIRADWTCGGDKDRQVKVQRIHDGDLDVLVNSDMLKEGFDCPRIACVGIFRMTASLGFLAQMIGRGTRRGKPDCLVLDPGLQVGLMQEAISPMELMAADWIDPEAMAEAAKELADSSGKTVDLLDAIERAQKKVQDRKERELEVVRVKAREMRIGGRATLYDPLDAANVLGMEYHVKELDTTSATPRQIELLARFKVDGHGMTRVRAKTTLDYLFSRAKSGKATMPMVSLMIGKGVDPDAARSMSFDEARETLDRLCGQRRRA